MSTPDTRYQFPPESWLAGASMVSMITSISDTRSGKRWAKATNIYLPDDCTGVFVLAAIKRAMLERGFEVIAVVNAAPCGSVWICDPQAFGRGYTSVTYIGDSIDESDS